MDTQQELLHELQVLVQEQGRQELCPLAFQPPPVLVDDFHTKPSRGLQTGLFQGLLFNIGQDIIFYMSYNSWYMTHEICHFERAQNFKFLDRKTLGDPTQ